MQTRQAPSHKVIQRGDAPMKKNGLVKPNIVETYFIEGTTIHIADNFVARTDEEKERVDDGVREVLMMIYSEEQE